MPTPSPDVQDLPTTSGSTPEDALHDLKDFVVELPAPDKLAFAGLTLSLLLCVFPWKETVQDGDSLGLLTSGALVALASLLGIGALAARDRQLLPRIAPSTLWIAQLMAATFSLIWCGVFIWMSWDSRVARSPIGNFEMPLSRPAAGVYLAVISSALGLYGTLRGLPRE